jgi:hypothetical protein
MKERMPVNIKKRLQVLTLIERAREDFKDGIMKNIPPEVIKTIEGGSSTVKAKKHQKYSDRYLEMITGKRTNKSSKSQRINTRSTTTGANSPLSFGENGRSKKSKIVTNSLASRFGKKRSPVNLKLSGEMLDSIQAVKTQNGVEVFFTDEKAQWHNEGVPQNNLPARRILPTNQGEEFNLNIFRRIMDAIKSALKKNL